MHALIWGRLLKHMCCGLGMACPPQAYMYEHLFSSWWCVGWVMEPLGVGGYWRGLITGDTPRCSIVEPHILSTLYFATVDIV